MYTINLKTNALEAAALIAPKKDVRYYLNGVFLSAGPEGGEIVATNGHMLYLHRVNDCTAWGGEHPRVIIPLDTIGAAVKIAKAQKMDKIAFTYHDEATPFYMLGGVRFDPVDGRYPDYWRIIPAGLRFAQHAKTFNTEYLRQMHKALLVGAGHGTGAKGLINNPLYQYDKEKDTEGASVFTIGAAENLGLIMPIRPPKDADGLLMESAFHKILCADGSHNLEGAA